MILLVVIKGLQLFVFLSELIELVLVHLGALLDILFDLDVLVQQVVLLLAECLLHLLLHAQQMAVVLVGLLHTLQILVKTLDQILVV